ncbi:unnamed protein product, partial [Tenebrio molitor]
SVACLTCVVLEVVVIILATIIIKFFWENLFLEERGSTMENFLYLLEPSRQRRERDVQKINSREIIEPEEL